ncbi:MAG: ATP-dependent DNA helicase RecQ, partial [Clostridiales bacterium]
QEQLIDAILSGRDVLGVMPTGAGKSICYQLPALMLPGITLVISPLISLMKDQVGALVQAGVPAAYLNSSLTPWQQGEMLRRAGLQRYKIIYVAPERLLTADFLRFIGETHVSMVTVDEAHCISQWGQDFRPSYVRIRDFIQSLAQPAVVSAFTATATPKVRRDIEEVLALKNPLLLTTGFDRPNLRFEVHKPQSKPRELLRLLQKLADKSGIVYCITRKTVEQVCDDLKQAGFAVTRYHGGLSDEERRNNQDDFLYDRKRIMVATNAFGMGIDKSNLGFVIHYNMPKDIESYYQEAGRAGRDGESADCILLYGKQDVVTNRFLIENGRNKTGALTPEQRALMTERELERLKMITFYCATGDCLRRYILKYFGETTPAHCGYCGNCNPVSADHADNEGKIIIKNKKPTPKSAVKVKRKGIDETQIDGALFDALKILRTQISLEEQVPAFVVFSDATLREICCILPRNDREFLSVSGVGLHKLERYGGRFLAVVAQMTRP